MMESIAVTRTINWGEFDGEMLNLILSKLFGKDRLSFSLVSKHWNAVAANSPCLMYYYPRTRAWRFYQYNSFFNIAFPDLEKSELRCSKHGWLLMSRYDDSLFFFDPSSNNRKVDLPCKVFEGCISLTFFNPPTSPECMVVGIKHFTPPKIFTLKHGEREWESTEFPAEEEEEDSGMMSFEVSIAPPVMHKGLIYVVSNDGDVATFDVEERRLKVELDCWRDDYVYSVKEQYLVKVDEETLYGVFVFDDDREVNVFRLSTSDMKWDSVEEGIGDRVLYLSHMSCFGHKASSKSMENTIRFPMFCGVDGGVPVYYSLSDYKYRSLDGEFEGDVYGIKRLSRATWIMPMPAAQEDTTTISWL